MGTIGINFKNIQHQYRTKDVLRGGQFPCRSLLHHVLGRREWGRKDNFDKGCSWLDQSEGRKYAVRRAKRRENPGEDRLRV